MSRNSNHDRLFDRIVGLGDKSFRKTWYPELQARIEELESSRALLQKTIDTAPVPIAYIDRERRYVFTNNDYVLRLASTKEAILGKTIEEVLGKENYAKVVESLDKAYAGTPQNFELERSHPVSGERRFYIVTYAPDLDEESGEVRGIVIATSDITQQKETEHELRVSREKIEASRRLLQAIIETAPIPIAYLDENERYAFANRNYLQMLNAEADEVIGRKMKEVLPPEAYDQIFEHSTRSYCGSMERFELTWVVPGTGEERVYIKRCAADVDERGVVHGVVSTLNDVTELKEAERALTAAKEAAEAGSRAKTEFLANMSHEMRTPLAGTLGMIGLVLDMKPGEEEKRLLETAQRSAEALLRLISDLLDFVSIETGKMPLKEEKFYLERCLVSALESQVGPAWEKDLKIGFSIDPRVPEEIMGDEARLRQVLIQLISNAVKFTEEGEVYAQVKVFKDEESGESLLFSVRDTGIGITAQKISLLFQKFTQVDSSTAKKYAGTGLGLALSRLIIEKMGGRIWAESTPGEGSEFFFSLPLKKG